MHIDILNTSEEQLESLYDDYYTKYSKKAPGELKKKLGVLKGLACVEMSDRVIIPFVCSVIGAFFSLLVGLKVITQNNFELEKIFNALLFIYSVMVVIWLCRLFSYERYYIGMQIYIIETILQEKTNGPEKDKNVLPEGTFEYRIQITPKDD